jgi:hypothetical protein
MGSKLNMERRFMLDEDLELYFDEGDIPKVFDLLEKYFKVSNVWRVRYSGYKRRFHNRYELEVFYQFLNENLEPAIKHLTQRRDHVVISLMKYVIKMKLDRGQSA